MQAACKQNFVKARKTSVIGKGLEYNMDKNKIYKNINKNNLAAPGFDPGTLGLWAQCAGLCAKPLFWVVKQLYNNKSTCHARF